jgi:hypothetical protein
MYILAVMYILALAQKIKVRCTSNVHFGIDDAPLLTRVIGRNKTKKIAKKN